MSIELQYQEVEERRIAAYTTFSRIYETENPIPEKKQQQQRRDWFIRGFMFLGLVCGMWVIASHTVPAFSRYKTTDVGIAAFFMLEAMLVAFGFYIYIARERQRLSTQTDDRHEIQYAHIISYMGRGIFIAFTVSCMAQVQDVLKDAGYGENVFGVLWTLASVAIEISKALAAPAMVLITGHVLAMLYVQDMANDRRAERDYETLYQAWLAEKMRLWKSQSARYGASIQVSTDRQTTAPLSIPLLSTQTDRQTDSRQAGAGYSRVSTAVETAKAWYLANPDQWNIPVRDLVDVIGVGKDSIAKARKELKGD